MEQVANLLQRAANSNAVINTLLASVFAVLSLRSVEQQRQIEALEAEKNSLVKANKGLKKTIWDWKQQLFSEAEANPQNTVVPLSTLKVIYGEATPAAPVVTGNFIFNTFFWVCFCVCETEMAIGLLFFCIMVISF